MKSTNTWIALDFETSSPNRYACEIAGIGMVKFNIKTGKITSKTYVPWIDGAVAWEYINVPCVMHNADFDLYLSVREGIGIKGEVHDTYLMAKHVTNGLPSYSLKSLAWYYFGDVYLPLLKLKEWFRKNRLPSEDDATFDLTRPPRSLVERYCLHDCTVTARLAHLFWTKHGMADHYAYDLDRRTIIETMELEARGIAIDRPACEEFKRLAKRRVRRNRRNAQLRMGTDRNPMGDALRDHLASLGETAKTATGKTKATDVELRNYGKRDKAMGSVQRVRRDEKHVSTYIDNMIAAAVPLSKRVSVFHPNLMQSAAVTRRWRARGFYSETGTITKGNTQNFPETIRQFVIARPGYEFWKFDLSSIEARMFCSFMELLMGEGVFAEMYRQDPMFNPYLWVIARCTRHGDVSKKHKLYVPYKHGTLGRLYCSGPKRFAQQLRDKFELDYTEDDCREIYRQIDREAPFIKKFQRFLLRLAEGNGFLSDPFGATYQTPVHKPYEIIAHLHSGAATGVFKWWLCEMRPARIKAGDHIVNLVHDEVNMEMKRGGARKRAKGYVEILDTLDIFGLPITADANKGRNWQECG